MRYVTFGTDSMFHYMLVHVILQQRCYGNLSKEMFLSGLKSFNLNAFKTSAQGYADILMLNIE
jgi:hypothetical protein